MDKTYALECRSLRPRSWLERTQPATCKGHAGQPLDLEPNAVRGAENRCGKTGCAHTAPVSPHARGYSWKYSVLKTSWPVGFRMIPLTFFWNATGTWLLAMKMRAASSWIICSACR